MSDAERAASFLGLARDDLAAARWLAEPFPRQAAYHLQQAVEKTVKALLVDAGIDPQPIHHIARLAQALAPAHPLRASSIALDHLTPHATSTRYPQPSGRPALVPTAAALAEYLRATDALLEAARRQLGLSG